MSELTEFSLSDIDENSNVTGLEEHSLLVKVSLYNTDLSQKNTAVLNPQKAQPSALPPKHIKRSSSISGAPRNPSKLSRQSSGSVRSRNKSPFTPTKDYLSPKPALNTDLHKFETVFKKTTNSIELNKSTNKDTFTAFLHMIGFVKIENYEEVDDLYKLFKTNPNPDYAKDLLLRVLSMTEEKKDSSKLKERFPGLFKAYFTKRTPKIAKVSYNLIQKNEVVTENYESLSDYLFSYQKNLEHKLEKTKEKVNKEKYKECTFKPAINKLSKFIDSTPKKLHKNRNSYLALKSENHARRTETLYEFAEVSRQLKEESVKCFLDEQSLKCPFSPAINVLKSGGNTPVKGMDEVVKRLQKARAEKKWKEQAMERGVPILRKDKENSTETFDLISDLEIELPSGKCDKILYYKGSNINFLISEFCLKHKISQNLHEKLTKILLKSKGREHHKLL